MDRTPKAENSIGELSRITVHEPVPPDIEDDITIREEIVMSAGKRAILRHKQFVIHLKGELAEARQEIARMRPIEIDHAKLKQTRRVHRWILSITGISLVVGGALVSTFQWNNNPIAFAIGWTMILLAALIQIPLNLMG